MHKAHTVSTDECHHGCDPQPCRASANWIGPDWVIFNIRGGNYRLITRVNFRYRSFFIKEFFTHQEYKGWRPPNV